MEVETDPRSQRLRTVARSAIASIATISLMSVGLAAPAIAGAGQSSPPLNTAARASKPLNVLFIIADDLAPRLGSYGAPVDTPHLDRLARQGVSFDRAYSQFPWCAPSRASFLTGTRPNTTKVMDLNMSFRAALPDIQTLPQYFRSNGYFTGRVGKIFHQGVPGGIGQSGPDDAPSWVQVVNPRGRDKDAEGTSLKTITPGVPLGSAMAWLDDDGTDEEQTDGMVASAAIEMIRANRDKPFFIGVGFYRPHVPEVAPRKYFAPYPLERMKVARETPQSLAKLLPATRAWTPDNFGMTVDEQRRMIQAYSAATSFMDAQVGRVLTALNELDLADDTIVVFTSDHGFLLGEHGQWMKNVLWEESARVPLIIRVPGTRSSGKRSPRAVELLDLYPTLTDVAGLPAYTRNEGVSLRPLLQNPADRTWTKPALSQVQGGRSVRTERWRYTEWEEGRLGRELYDLVRDPRQQRNLAGSPRHASVVAMLKKMLPAGAVEKRPPPQRYDAIRDCMIRPSESFPRPPASGGQAGGGDGVYGLKVCATVDP